MPSQKCTVAFSGLKAIDDAHYATSDGHSPGVLTVRVAAYPFGLNYYSGALFSDGTNIYPIPDCRVRSIQYTNTMGGYSWMIEVEDHRWRWQNSKISGTYNVEDNRGNLIPGMIKTPKELAILCLDRLGETVYEIDMPEGVKEKEGPRDEFPPPGEGIKSVKAELNPPINWVNVSTAEALVQLCDSYDRALIWCNLDQKVKIMKRSQGEELPTGFVESSSESLMLPPLPSGVGVIGAEIKWQIRFLTEDVGLEYDGRLVKINDLSYAPTIDPRPAQHKVNLAGLYNPATNYVLTVNGRSYSVTGAGGENETLAYFAAQINADTVLSGQVNANVAGGPMLLVTGMTNDAKVTVSGTNMLTQQIEPSVDNRWQFSFPPLYPGVNAAATGGPDRLSYRQAMGRAQGSVFKTRRITLNDPANGPFEPQESLYVRRFGFVTRYQQVLLDPIKVEQVTPEPRDPDRRVTSGIGGDLVADVPNYYDGYSRGRQHEVFGSVARKISGPVFRTYAGDKTGTKRYNTNFEDRVEISSSVDAQNWCIVFDSPVYEMEKENRIWKAKRARLILETSCRLRHPETNEVIRYRRWVKFGRQEETDKTKEKRDKPKQLARMDNDENSLRYDRDPNILWFNHSDECFRTWKQTYVVDEERRRHVVVGSEFDQYDNARTNADRYIDEHIKRIILEGGYTRTYAGVKLVKLNGAIRQVSLQFSASSLTTTASYNREHDQYVPTANVRRFREALAPDVEAAQQNRTFSKVSSEKNNRIIEGMLGRARSKGG